MNAIILHGSFNSRKQIEEYWIPEIRIFFDKIIFPDFPTEDFEEMTSIGQTYVPSKQNLDSWTSEFVKYIPQIKALDEIVLISHSTGPLFSLSMIQEYEIDINTSFFVAPFLNDLQIAPWQAKIVNKTFYSNFNFEKIKKRIQKSIVLLSDNDPYVDRKNSIDFAAMTNSKIVEFHDAGHFNKEGSGKLIANILKENTVI